MMNDLQNDVREEQGHSTRRAPRNRFRPYAQERMRLEERDEQILTDLFLNRLMTRRQIERLYFSSTVRCNARLRQLFDHHFVGRYYPPYSPFGAQAIYSVGKAALPIIARRLEMEMSEVARYYRRTQTPTFIEHTTTIVDVYLAFREVALKQADIQVECWLAEMQCRHEWEIRLHGSDRQNSGWHKEAFKPDAFVRLQTSRGYLNFFLEIDLGHTSSRQFLGKLLTHQRYMESGLFQQIYDCASFYTLVFTTGIRRLRNLRELTEAHKSEIFCFTTLEEGITNLLQPIWSVPFTSQNIALLEFQEYEK